MTINNVAYGEDTKENGERYFYVQICCNDEHKGQECDCEDVGHFPNLALAQFKATMLAKQLGVPVQYDNEVNK